MHPGATPPVRMGRMVWEKELEVARAAATQAGEIALRYQAQGVEAEAKADESPVTVADRECEKLISRILLEAFPDDGLLGEEGALKESRSGRRWIIDPVDGTRDFVRGSDTWGMLIALEADSEVVAGVCHQPAQKELYSASRGAGALRNDDRVRVSEITSPSQSVLCVNGINDIADLPFAGRLLEFTKQFWAVRSMGGCQDAMMVAGGRAEAWIEPSAKPWDLAPLKIIAEEAGARFFNFDGGSSIYGGNCILCVPALEELMRQFLGL
ncbi:MAG TPA: inositol monophosphatase family protein [Bryobacteraceae bacterium]|nr:inositol monophosphatase family protein [Bryobacteraceae bacterium]